MATHFSPPTSGKIPDWEWYGGLSKEGLPEHLNHRAPKNYHSRFINLWKMPSSYPP